MNTEDHVKTAPASDYQNVANSGSDRPTISQEQLAEFMKYLVSNLVTKKGEVEIAVMEDIPGAYTVHIKVSPEDKGRIIGKKGNTINAIRSLVRVFGRIIVLVQD